MVTIRDNGDICWQKTLLLPRASKGTWFHLRNPEGRNQRELYLGLNESLQSSVENQKMLIDLNVYCLKAFLLLVAYKALPIAPPCDLHSSCSPLTLRSPAILALQLFLARATPASRVLDWLFLACWRFFYQVPVGSLPHLLSGVYTSSQVFTQISLSQWRLPWSSINMSTCLPPQPHHFRHCILFYYFS